MTFFIVAIDGESGSCGSAAVSFSLTVGGTVSYSRIGVGAVTTQHCAHLSLGQRVLEEWTGPELHRLRDLFRQFRR